jgi:hypothetical protein
LLYTRSIFSDDDIRGMIAFYETPAGEHHLKDLPQLMSDTMKIGYGCR